MSKELDSLTIYVLTLLQIIYYQSIIILKRQKTTNYYIFYERIEVLMLHFILCDDQKLLLDNLKISLDNIIVTNSLSGHIKLMTTNYREVIKFAEKKGSNVTHVYILDIDLNDDINGLQVAKIIRESDPNSYIIFLTAHAHLSIFTYKYRLEAFDFLIKPLEKRELEDCILNLFERHSKKNVQRNEHKIVIKSGPFSVKLSEDQIIAFEKVKGKDKIIVHTTSGMREMSGSLKNLFEELNLSSNFLLCHQSYLVNIKHISELNIKESFIRMSTNEIYPVSRTKIKELKNYVIS